MDGRRLVAARYLRSRVRLRQRMDGSAAVHRDSLYLVAQGRLLPSTCWQQCVARTVIATPTPQLCSAFSAAAHTTRLSANIYRYRYRYRYHCDACPQRDRPARHSSPSPAQPHVHPHHPTCVLQGLSAFRQRPVRIGDSVLFCGAYSVQRGNELFVQTSLLFEFA